MKPPIASSTCTCCAFCLCPDDEDNQRLKKRLFASVISNFLLTYYICVFSFLISVAKWKMF